MRAPAFWLADGALPALLTPLAGLWGWAARRRSRRPGWRAPVPVICVGNLVAGGAGKTPVALAVARRLSLQARAPHLLGRGYGGSARGPLRVDPARHDCGVVGDEALLLAAAAPAWVARDRVAGARAAVAAGAGCIVLDDGFQDPTLVKDVSLLVIDGAYGFGNGRLLPAGPLREPVRQGLARADAVVLLGDDRHALRARLGAVPVLGARLAAAAGADAVRGKRVVAFAGIGRPEKFFETLQSLSCDLLGADRFADHHRYRDYELLALADKADRLGALLATTAKDRARLPAHLGALVTAVEVEVAWDAPAALDAALARAFAGG